MYSSTGSACEFKMAASRAAIYIYIENRYVQRSGRPLTFGAARTQSDYPQSSGRVRVRVGLRLGLGKSLIPVSRPKIKAPDLCA